MKLCPRSDIDAVWPVVAPMLKRACDRPEFDVWTLEKAEYELRNNNAELWVLSDGDTPCAALLTQVDHNTRAGIIALVGGRNILRGAAEHLWMIEAWARLYGAKTMMMDGRKGWVRFLKSFGYRADGTIVIKDL